MQTWIGAHVVAEFAKNSTVTNAGMIVMAIVAIILGAGFLIWFFWSLFFEKNEYND